MTTDVITTTGNGTWDAPTGVTSVIVRCWGGGGAGGGRSSGTATGSGGGAGGAYAEKTTFSVTPGNTYNLYVATTRTATATSSAATNTGDVTWFSSNDTNGCVAIGGPGGSPNATTAGTGTTTGCFGDTVRAGGNGNVGQAALNGGGGGGGAGTANAGGNGSGATGGTGGSLSGGNGGTGKAAGSTGAGGAGSNYGGGGGGAYRHTTGSGNGGTGAQGRIELEYTASTGQNSVGILIG